MTLKRVGRRPFAIVVVALVSARNRISEAGMKRERERKEWRGVYYYDDDDYRVLPGNGESNHWQEACARRQSRELLSFSQLGWRWGEEQNKWNKIGKGSASTANPRRRLGSNISIML